IPGEKLARGIRPEPMHHVVDSIRKSGLFHALREGRCGRRRLFRWLYHYRVTASQGWRNFPRQQQQGKIPWSDDPNHTQWLAQRIVERILAVWGFCVERLGARWLDEAGKHAKVRSSSRDIEFGSQ